MGIVPCYHYHLLCLQGGVSALEDSNMPGEIPVPWQLMNDWVCMSDGEDQRMLFCNSLKFGYSVGCTIRLRPVTP